MKFKSTLFLTLVTLGLSQAESKKPNIIFLLTDDQTVSSIGRYGNSDVVTPHMDSLADDGMIFDRHYNTTAICMASRANIFTGKYEYKTGTNFHKPSSKMRTSVWEKSYPVLIKEQGYLTAFAGKFGIEVEQKGLCEEDFDFWGGGHGQTHYKTSTNSSMAKYAIDYPHSTLSYGAFGQDVIKESVVQGKPFCLSISFKAPHKPATPDPQFDHIYQGKTFTKPVNYGREHSLHLSEQSKQDRQYTRFEEWGYDDNYDAVMATYYQQIYAVDVSLGMIRDELTSQGIADNTVIIFTSDNGFFCGAHGYGSKVLPYEEASRAPLIIFDPRAKTSGKKLRSRRLTANIDFAPTILDLAGAAVPAEMDGHSLLPLLDRQENRVRTQLSMMNTWGNTPTTALSCITEDEKYIFWWYEDETMSAKEELFDLKNDPYELNDISSTHPELLKTMRQKYTVELQRWKDTSVNYNHYEKFATLFDPTVPFADKKTLLAQMGKKAKNKKKKTISLP